MPLVIPDQEANWHITFQNGSGGASGRSSIAIGTRNASALDQTIVARVANLFRDNFAPLFDNSWLMGPIHVVEGDSPVNKVWDDTGTEAGTQGSTAVVAPAGAVVVSKVTGFSGVRNRGRVYLPGLPETQVDEAGIVFGTWVNTVQAAFDDLQTDLLADAAIDDIVLFHDADTPGSENSLAITSFVVRTVVGNMRPRQRR